MLLQQVTGSEAVRVHISDIGTKELFVTINGSENLLSSYEDLSSTKKADPQAPSSSSKPVMLMLNDLRELGIEVWQQRIPKQVFLSLSVTLGQVVEHAVSTLPLSICIVAVPHPSKTNILFSENQNGLLLRSTPIISLLFRTGSRQSEIFGVLTLSNWPSTPNSSRWLSAGRYGLEDLQSTMYHLLTEQSAPIPKGYGILTFPHLSLHPDLAYLGIAIEKKASKW
ncbi:hypothetical protein HanRHA438_Chr14g0651641 [Helianthus annuus]|nr:hypothetical protein HanRHA438_Chr14g0651641 [Helianthus annuus]